MPSLLQLRNYSFLSQAAYRDLSTLGGSQSPDDLQNALRNTASALGKDKIFTDFQAQLLTGSATADPTDGYSFVDHHANDPVGFSASVFKSNADGSYTVAVRGTEPGGLQYVTDLLVADVLGVALSGKAREQTIAAYRYYKQLATAPGQAVVYTEPEKLRLAGLYGGLYSPLTTTAAYLSISGLVASDVGLGSGSSQALIPLGARVNFTGHSLGGHVATLLAELIAKNATGNVGDVVTYNAPGVGGIGGKMLGWCGFNGADATLAAKITNVIGEGGIDVTAGLGYTAGSRQDIYIEKEGGAVSIDNHSIVKLSDSLALQTTYKTFCPALTPAQIDACVRQASNHQDNTLESSLDALRTLLMDGAIATDQTKRTAVGNREVFYTNLQALQNSPAYTALSGSAALQLLDATPAAILADQAKTDFGRFFALNYLLPFALTGASGTLTPIHQTLHDTWQADRDLTPEQRRAGQATHTDEWHADRAAMLGWLLKANAADQTYVDSGQNLDGAWYFADNATNKAILVQPAGGLGNAEHQVLFGSDADSNLAGGGKTDRLYGMGGNDTLIGQGGADYLEGNDGNDTLDGGAGADSLLGGLGNDTLSGGGEADTLNGNAGDDTLAGGTGADQLIGGQGNDTYRIASGDGDDTITDWSGDAYDGDGLGKIEFDGQDLTRAYDLKANSNSQWGDTNWTLEYTGIPGGRGLLTIGKVGGTDHLLIPNFQSGDLGIVLKPGTPRPRPAPINPTRSPTPIGAAATRASSATATTTPSRTSARAPTSSKAATASTTSTAAPATTGSMPTAKSPSRRRSPPPTCPPLPQPAPRRLAAVPGTTCWSAPPAATTNWAVAAAT